MDIINIKAIKCIIVNTTPMLSDNCGTAYEIHRCGLPTYHIHPMHQYWGYGMHPFGPKNWHHGLYPHYDYFCRNPYGRTYLKPIHTENKPYEFIAPVKALPERNKVRVFFPATAQMLCGLYSLTFVIDLFEPGYHCNNLRTITVDYNNIFELVPNMEGAAGDITIDIDKQLGINVYDNLMFGNVISSNTGDESPLIQNIEIVPLTDISDGIRVGKSVWFKCLADGEETTKVNWRLIGNEKCASLPTQSGGRVLLNAKGVTDMIEGESYVDLEAVTTDGSNLTEMVHIKIHNYATDIFVGSYSDRIEIGTKGDVTAPIYVLQEDGTRVSVCDSTCNCQAVSIAQISVTDPTGTDHPYDFCDVYIGTNKEGGDCQWNYDTSTSNTNSSVTDESSNNCCPDVKLFIHNTNDDLNAKQYKLIVKSRLKKADGTNAEKEYELYLKGRAEEMETTNDGFPHDRFVTSGEYSNNYIRFTNTDSSKNFNINVEDLANENAWYTPGN